MINFLIIKRQSINLCLSVLYGIIHCLYQQSVPEGVRSRALAMCLSVWPCACQSLRLKTCGHSFKERRKQIAIMVCFAKIKSPTKICVQYLLKECKSNGE